MTCADLVFRWVVLEAQRQTVDALQLGLVDEAAVDGEPQVFVQSTVRRRITGPAVQH